MTGPYRDDKNNLELALEKITKKLDVISDDQIVIKKYVDSQTKEKFGIFRFFRALLASSTLGMEAARVKVRNYEFKGELFMVLHWIFLIGMGIGLVIVLSRTACTHIDANTELFDQHREVADRRYCEPACAVISAQYVTRNHSCVHTHQSTCDSSYTDVCSCTRDGHFFMVNPESGMIRERGPYVAPDLLPNESH